MPDDIDTGEATADTGSHEDTQSDNANQESAVQNGADPATQPGAATDTAPDTTDTRSNESPQEMLDRLVPEKADPTPDATARVAAPGTAQPSGAPASPFAHLSSDFQKLLADPAQAQRLENTYKLYGQQANEIGALRQQTQAYQGLPPADQMRALIEQQKRQAEIAQYKPWHPKAPESARANERITRARMFKDANAAASSMEPQQREAYLGQLAKQWRVTREDIDLLNQYEDHTAQTQERLTKDPDGWFDEMFEARAQAWQQRQEFRQQQTMGAQQFLEKNQDLLTKHADKAVWAMQNENRRDVALRIVQLEEELSKLRTTGVQNAEAVATAQARDAITKRRATVGRDAATTAADPASAVLSRAQRENWPQAKILDALLKAREQNG